MFREYVLLDSPATRSDTAAHPVQETSCLSVNVETESAAEEETVLLATSAVNFELSSTSNVCFIHCKKK